MANRIHANSKVRPLSSIADARMTDNPSICSMLQLWAHRAELDPREYARRHWETSRLHCIG